MQKRTVYTTREEWLAEARDQIGAVLFAGVEIPNIRVGVGFPSAGKRSNVIGECWSKNASGDATHEIIIRVECANPVGTDQYRYADGVLAILTHEMAHAIDGCEHGHGREFKTLAEGAGLTGPMTATIPTDELREAFEAWTTYGDIGAYPMAKFGGLAGGTGPDGGPIIKSSGPKKQGTRMLKAWCEACGYTVRSTARWLDIAAPNCPNPECEREGEEMTTERNAQ